MKKASKGMVRTACVVKMQKVSKLLLRVWQITVYYLFI